MAMFARDANAGIALFPFNYGTICLSVKINPVMRGRVRHRTTHPEVCAKRERLCMKTVCVKGFFSVPMWYSGYSFVRSKSDR